MAKKKNNNSNIEPQDENVVNLSNEEAGSESASEQKNVEEMIDEAMSDIDVDGIEEENKETDTAMSPDALMAQAAEQLEAARAEAKEWKDNYTRVYAEWDTYRRRVDEQRQEDKATATESLVTEILPILDDFERSIDYAKNNDETGLLEGVEAVHNKLIDACKKSGMEVIDPEYGDAFDSLDHQAVQTVEDSQVYEESIHSVLQKGFRLGKKVLRPATVVLTTGGETRPKEEVEEENVESDQASEE